MSIWPLSLALTTPDPTPTPPAEIAKAAVLLEAVAPFGFCLAGGAALVALGLSSRPTRDIDPFTAERTDFGDVTRRAVDALTDAGFEVTIERSYEELATILVTAAGRRRSQFRVDLGRDRMIWPPVTTALGPTASPRELAASKLLALFGRVQPRDLADVAALAERLTLDDMLADARTKDPGFDTDVLAEMVGLVVARPDDEWPAGSDPDALRAFGRDLIERLNAGNR